jgi:hypothetical protein
MKECRQCHALLPINKFYKHPQMGDGHLNKCITCVVKRVTRHRDLNLERIRAYDRERAKSRPRFKMPRYKKNAEQQARRKLKPEPCYLCGEKKVHAHHPDYSKPLEVFWLCQRCHTKIHRILAVSDRPF